MAIYIRCTGNQIACHDRNFYSKGMKIIFHILIKITIHRNAKFHKISIAGRTFIFFPFSQRVAFRLIEITCGSLHSSFLRIFFLAKRTFSFKRPCFFQTLSCSIFHQEEAVKTILYLIPIWLHLFPLICVHRSFNRRIFIIDLNRDHRRIVNQCKTCIRIHMTENLSGIFFLQLYHPFIVHGKTFDAASRISWVVQSISFYKISCNDKINMKVNTPLFQFCDKIVKSIQTFRMKFSPVSFFII